MVVMRFKCNLCSTCGIVIWSPVPLTIFFGQIWNSMKFCNALVHYIFGWSQQNFAHVTTVTLSWHVQNFVMISSARSKLEQGKFLLNFEFHQSTVSGMGAWYAISCCIGSCLEEVFYELKVYICSAVIIAMAHTISCHMGQYCHKNLLSHR